jgi:hypothetical protein
MEEGGRKVCRSMSINNVVIITSRGDIHPVSDSPRNGIFKGSTIAEAMARLVEYAAMLESKEIHDYSNSTESSNNSSR